MAALFVNLIFLHYCIAEIIGFLAKNVNLKTKQPKSSSRHCQHIIFDTKSLNSISLIFSYVTLAPMAGHTLNVHAHMWPSLTKCQSNFDHDFKFCFFFENDNCLNFSLLSYVAIYGDFTEFLLLTQKWRYALVSVFWAISPFCQTGSHICDWICDRYLFHTFDISVYKVLPQLTPFSL